MRILYIFPHPDDESFGPAGAMHQQIQAGHHVYLLTLTRGGATRQRHVLGLSIAEMGEVRLQEMQAMANVLSLYEMTVLDLEDSGLQDMDPRELEQVIRTHIERIQPQIIVTYPVHGISGFHDHLITHAIVKRVFLEMRDQGATYLQRLAYFTIRDNGESVFQPTGLRIKQSDDARIDVEIALRDEDVQKLVDCLNCYTTYQNTIAQSGVINQIGRVVYFEIFQESHVPRLPQLEAGLSH